jgi:hypothetical protein
MCPVQDKQDGTYHQRYNQCGCNHAQAVPPGLSFVHGRGGASWPYVPEAVLSVRYLLMGLHMHRNITIDKALMYASEMLSILTFRAVHETKITDEALVLFIPLFRK